MNSELPVICIWNILYLEHKEMPCGALDALYGRDDNEIGLVSQGKSCGKATA